MIEQKTTLIKISSPGQTQAILFKLEDMEKALIEVDELMHRLVLQNQYLLLGDTAKAAVDNGFLPTDSLETGLEERYFTKEVVSSIETFFAKQGVKVTDSGFSFISEQGVPVKVKKIHNRYQFFKYPSTVIYLWEDYQVANPWQSYWEAKDAIQ